MTSVEYLGSYRLTQSDDYFKLGRDSVLLARFATLRKGWSVCDLGCGVGSLLLLLSQREEELDRVGIELNPGAAALARQNLADNGLAGAILPGDLRDRTLLAGDRFHLVVSNPPYFRAGSGKSGGQARMDDTCSVADLCQAAGRLVRTGGRFALVYRPERLAELFAALAAARLDGLTLKPGETLSFWRAVGRPTRRRGYVEGMILRNGRVASGVGGGLCQMTNLLYWMTLHTPLTVTERWRHGYDVFPDSNRTQPFGSGATCAYPHRDLMIRNDTDHA